MPWSARPCETSAVPWACSCISSVRVCSCPWDIEPCDPMMCRSPDPEGHALGWNICNGGTYAGQTRYATIADVALGRVVLTVPTLRRAVAVPHVVCDARAVCGLWPAL